MGQTKTSIRIDDQLLEEVQLACVRRKTTQTEAVDWGLRAWLKAEGPAVRDGINQNQTVTGVGNIANQRNTVGRVPAEPREPLAGLDEVTRYVHGLLNPARTLDPTERAMADYIQRFFEAKKSEGETVKHRKSR